jgi:hypothetical protein
MKDLNKNINSFNKEPSEELSNKKTWQDPELLLLSLDKTGTEVHYDGNDINAAYS